MATSRYTCPCCGYKTSDEPPGSYNICAVCAREDDPVQLLDPWFSGGANRPNLADAQASFAACGAKERRSLPHVRPTLPSDTRDQAWRLVTEHDRIFVCTPSTLSTNEYRDPKAR